MDDDRTAVDVVRRQFAIAQRDEERAHLLGRHHVTGLDGRLARYSRHEMLVPRGRGSGAIDAERGECRAQTTLGVEALVRRRHRVDDYALPAEVAELAPE